MIRKKGSLRLFREFLFRRRLAKYAQPRTAITTMTMPAIAPAEKFLCEELLSLVGPVSEVRLGRVAKVENVGVNVI
jgi:hypothetical protein